MAAMNNKPNDSKPASTTSSTGANQNFRILNVTEYAAELDELMKAEQGQANLRGGRTGG